LSRLGLTYIWPDDKSGSNHSGKFKNMYNYSDRQKIFPLFSSMSSLECYTIQDKW
jgi:hypothetical protein